jgi:predicted ATPase/DNA-binding winged helix-turn-helix (wHTH) protein
VNDSCRKKSNVVVELVTTQNNDRILFGPFTLIPSERLLAKEGAPVELGTRALDILIALASRSNEAVSKADLLAWIWPDVLVEEGSLRFHIANLRKALGDGKDGARYIATLTGRGYCFVAPILRVGRFSNGSAPETRSFSHANMPNRPVGMIGRTEDVKALLQQLVRYRFVTIVGTGGVGKTTVAVEAGYDLIESFAGAVVFVDLGVLADPALVPTAIASMLGLSIQSDDPAPDLVAFLRDKRLLLILDTCEHLIDSAAALAAQIFLAAPQVHILATSREALQVEGERIHRLAPLATPPEESKATAALIQMYPATRLFIERAAASGAVLQADNDDAAIIAEICRKLDGLALAIELVARRVETYGLRQTAALLNRSLALLWVGSRNAPPRQKTLRAALEWSYGLLSDLERAVLGRLTVFVGNFTINAALAVVPSATIDQAAVFGAVDNLISKSMVATRPAGAMMRYRLLDTTRAFALEFSGHDAERDDLAARHACYYRRWLEQSSAEGRALSSGAERAAHLAVLSNLRAALEWCFGPNGNTGIGVGIAAAAAPTFLALSLLPECHRWSERAILALDDTARAGRDEMHLQAALGVSLMFMRGGKDAARRALSRSLVIAERTRDTFEELQVLAPLQMFHMRVGDFKAALSYARRCAAAAATLEDPVASTLARSLLGISLHFLGDHNAARAELEAALWHSPPSQRTTTVYIGFECSILAGAILARTLWMQGHSVQAVEQARQTVKDAADMGHSLTLSIALIWSISVFTETSDLEIAEEHIDWLISRAEAHSLAPYLAVARGFRAELMIHRGGAIRGIQDLEECIRVFHAAPYEMLTTSFKISLIQGLMAVGRFTDCLALLNDTIHRVEENGDFCYMPELLRVRGTLLLAMPCPDTDGAEVCFRHALELSRRQGALIWELRATTDLAALLSARGQPDGARTLLKPVVERFAEGTQMAGLVAAERLLAALN